MVGASRLRSNRISTLNKNKADSTNVDSLTVYKKKLLESRKGTHTNLLTRKQIHPEIDNGVYVTKTNVIYCPDCRNLIDIKDILDNNEDLTNAPQVRCKTCGNTEIDLVLELKKQNKLELLSSGGIPSGNLFGMSETKIQDQIVRPSILTKRYERDINTGLIIRKVETITMNKNKLKGRNKEFIENYENYLSAEEKTIYQPVKKMIDQGMKITNIIDI